MVLGNSAARASLKTRCAWELLTTGDCGWSARYDLVFLPCLNEVIDKVCAADRGFRVQQMLTGLEILSSKTRLAKGRGKSHTRARRWWSADSWVL